jgi:hypothetical protein
MVVSKNTAGTIALAFFGAIFTLLFIGAVAIVEDAERSRVMRGSFFPENTASNSAYPNLDPLSLPPPMYLPIDNDHQEIPILRDFLMDAPRSDRQFVPDRFDGQEHGIQR